MASSNSDSSSSEEIRDTAAATATSPQGGSAPLALVLLLSLAAGGVIVGITMSVFPIFSIPLELQVPEPSAEIMAAYQAKVAEVRMMHSVVFFCMLTVIMSLLVGAGELMSRRFAGSAFLGLIAGLLLAAIVGAASGAFGHTIFKSIGSFEGLTPIIRTFLVHASILALCGAAIAAAVGLVSGGVSGAVNNIASGLMAGILVAFLFPVVTSFALPREQTEVMIPGAGMVGVADQSLPMLGLYVGMIVVALGLLIPLGNRPKKPTSQPQRDAGE
jgi:hypothetical protein